MKKKTIKKIYTELNLRGNFHDLMSFRGNITPVEFEMIRDLLEIVWKVPQNDTDFDDCYKKYYKEVKKLVEKFNSEIDKL